MRSKGNLPSASLRRRPGSLKPGICRALAETWDLRCHEQYSLQHSLGQIVVQKRSGKKWVFWEPWTTPVPVPQSSMQKPGFTLLRLEMYNTDALSTVESQNGREEGLSICINWTDRAYRVEPGLKTSLSFELFLSVEKDLTTEDLYRSDLRACVPIPWKCLLNSFHSTGHQMPALYFTIRNKFIFLF